MHDNQLEDRLRQVLRAEGDSLRLTVTPAELRRHQALRQRERSSRRVILGAAAVLVVAAVATSAGLLFNRSDGPSIGTSPSPSASANPTATASAVSLAPVADIAPYAGYQTLGRANGPDGNPEVTIVGALAKQGDYMLVSAACTGIGILTITGSPNDSSNVNCPTVPTAPVRMLPYLGDTTQFSVRVTASGNVRYQVLVEGSDLLLPHPPVVLRHGTDEATMGVGCGGVISLGWGYDTSDSCGTTLPSTPLETLELATGEVATVSLDGWTITSASAECGLIKTEAGSPASFEAQPNCTVIAAVANSMISVSGPQSTSVKWVLELRLTARNAGGDSFSGPFYAYLMVR